MTIFKSVLYILKDYCLNSSVAGVSYVADSRYHYTERIFWISCLVLSTFLSHHLIMDALEEVETSSLSMVVESVPPLEKTHFPSIGICEMGHTKEIYEKLTEIVTKLQPKSDDDVPDDEEEKPLLDEDKDEDDDDDDDDYEEDENYNYDVEDFLLRIIFHNLYNFGSIVSYCQPYKDCDDCTKCPENGYAEYSNMIRANCSNLLTECHWNDRPFNCCQYFQPLQTTLGKCYLINSVQIVEKNGPNWFNMEMGVETGPGQLKLGFSKAVSLFIINEEDIPHMLLTTLQFKHQHEGSEANILLSVQNVINDEGVRLIDPEIRKCIFPNEQSISDYKYYSYSTCVTECLKQEQIKVCNCTHHNMIYDENDKSPVCDYNGLTCLDAADMIFPQTTIMQPWRTNGLVCDCLPSCSEHEVKLVGRYQRNIPTPLRTATIKLQSLPSQRYRRQAVKDNLDIVVSIGGILGLFLGASILSGVEFIYFFSVRLIGTAYLNRKQK